MRKSILLLLMICFVVNAQAARADDPGLKDRWGTVVSKEELKHSHRFNPFRIMNRTFDAFVHFGLAVGDLANFKKKDHIADATFQFAESFLDPFDLTNDIISDVGAAIKSPRYIGHRMSRRVQVCSGNIGLISDEGVRKYPVDSLIFDVYHVGVMIDRDETFTDTGGGGMNDIKAEGGMDCSSVPIMSNEPEEVAMLRLTYIANSYRPKYDFMTANCGYFTRDVLSASGFAYPIFTNAGIGTELPVTLEQSNFWKRRKSDLSDLNTARNDSTKFIEKIRTAFDELENGTVPDVTFNVVDLTQSLTSDAALQMVISATRGKNPDAQTWVSNNLPIFPLVMGLNQIRNYGQTPAGKRLYTQMMNGLQPADLAWALKDQPAMQNEMTSILNAILQ
jgi:hypothetical protein